jgi:hypothetical protein
MFAKKYVNILKNYAITCLWKYVINVFH